MKLIIETGSESHTTSYASLKAFYVGGPHNGKQLYEVKSIITSTEWLKSDKHAKWVRTTFDLPEGTTIEVIGKGGIGARGAEKRNTDHFYRLDLAAEVLDTTIDTGLRECMLKGRLVLVKDVLAEIEASKVANLDEGF